MVKQTLLLVDGDVQSLRVLEVSLRDAGFAVHTARNGAEALTKAASVPPDLILTDTALPVLDGFELCKRLKADPALGDAALVFLSADGAVETKVRGLEMGAEDYLVRPITTREVIARVRLLLQRRDRERAERAPGRRRLAGRLEDMGVVDLLQTMAIGHKSGTLRVERPPHQATIWFRGGAVIDATSGPLTGDEAVYRLLTWSSGEFEIDFHTPTKPQTMSISTAHLLMEGMRRLDEWGRIREQLPPLELVFEVDYEVLSDRLADLPDEANVLLRYLDGRRTGHEVIDDSDLPDLTALELMSRLYFEGVIQPGATAPRRVVADAPPALVSQTAKTNPAKPAPVGESLGDVLARSAVRHSAEYPAVPDPAPEPALAWGNVPASTARPRRVVRPAPLAVPKAEEEFPSLTRSGALADAGDEHDFFDSGRSLAVEPHGKSRCSAMRRILPAAASRSALIGMGLAALVIVGGLGFLVLRDTVEPRTPAANALHGRWHAELLDKRQPVGKVAPVEGDARIPNEPGGGPTPPLPRFDEPAPAEAPPAEAPPAEAPVEAPAAQKPAAPPEARALDPKPAPTPEPPAPAEPSGDAAALIAEARKLHDGRQYKQALVRYEKALALTPNDQGTLVWYAKALLEVSRLREALTAAEKAARLNPNDAETFMLIGNARQDLGQLEPAIEAYEKYLKLAPSGTYADELRQVIKAMKQSLGQP